MKRVFLLIATNLAVMVVLSIIASLFAGHPIIEDRIAAPGQLH